MSDESSSTSRSRLGDADLLADAPSITTRYRSELGLVLATFAVLLVTTLVNRSYVQLPMQNAQEILRQTALLGIFALGAGVVIISGGIDLSSGSVIAFSSSVCGLVMMALAPVNETGASDLELLPTWGLCVAIVAALLCGLAVGTIHAWLITVIRLPPFVATLASLVGLRSLARLMNQSVTQSLGKRVTKLTINNDAFLWLDTWWVPLAVFLVLGFGTWLIMSRTVLGRHLQAMGGNEEAARLSGISTESLKWFAYSFGAVTASIAGMFYAARAGSVDPVTMGLGYELNAIAAAVVGGCSLRGGVGQVPGIMLGVLFLRVVIHSVSKLIKGSPGEYEGMIVGLLIGLAVAFNELRSGRLGARQQFFPGKLGLAMVLLLALLIGVVLQVLVGPHFTANRAGLIVGLATFVLLGWLAWYERHE